MDDPTKRGWLHGWHLTTFEPLDHVDGCKCEAADGFTIEEADPRCETDRPEHAAVYLDDGSYTIACIDLTEFAAAVRRAADLDIDEPAFLVRQDGSVQMLAFVQETPNG